MNYHFIAIGGSAMHNLAIALHNQGHVVTGSDDEIFEPSRSRLENLGLLPNETGWFPDKITQNIDAVVLGMHARIDNAELIRAQELGVTIFSYPEFLYEQTKEKKRIVIGGSHGKTTTTAMLLHVFKTCGKKFDFMVGAQLDGFDTMVEFNQDSEFAIFEGDEYLTSPIDLRPKFHLYKPHIALLTGVAWDHINVFPTFENYCEQFQVFADLIEPNGSLIYFKKDDVLNSIAANLRSDIKPVAYDSLPHTIKNGVTFVKEESSEMPLQIFGKHNLQNLTGALQVCLEAGISRQDFLDAIKTFKGASKRLQKLASNSKTSVFLDFAHSPSKLKATVNAVKQQFSKKNVIAFMELHTFSSLNIKFLKEYEGSLENADQAYVYYSKHAIEHKKLEDIDPQQVFDAFKKNDLIVINQKEKLLNALMKLEKENTVFLFLSSGNFSGIDLKALANDLVN